MKLTIEQEFELFLIPDDDLSDSTFEFSKGWLDDWRTYVPNHVKNHWGKFSNRERVLIAIMARHLMPTNKDTLKKD